MVQGIGQALFERTVYSEDGQFLTGSFTDYALPRAADTPSFRIDYHSVPAKTNVLGAKGCGEAGCAGSLPSVMNAISDALGGKHGSSRFCRPVPASVLSIAMRHSA